MRKQKFSLILLLCTGISGMLLCGCSQDSGETQDPALIQDDENATTPIETAFDPEQYPTSKPPEETLVPVSTEIDADATSLDQFVYEIRADGTAIILDFTGSDTELVISSEIGGYPVTEIGQYAFEAAWDVTSVVLPDTIEIINEQAFADCEMLSGINIPESVTTIGRGAFSNCMNLTELTIPAGVTETSEEMLTNCLALENLFIVNPDLEYTSWGLEEIEFASGTPCMIHAPEGSKILAWAEENQFPIAE